jgi:uncharacterized protein (TIGR02301 family)
MNVTLPRCRRPLAVRVAAAAAAVVMAFGAMEAAAQTRPAAAPPPPVTAPAPPDAHPPYEPQLLRLAEIIGALAYLRDLCGDHDGDKWRAKMANLLAAEAAASANERERERLAGAYNQGFHGYALTYRSCTANAKLVIERYLDEGERLTRDVENRYGGG